MISIDEKIQRLQFILDNGALSTEEKSQVDAMIYKLQAQKSMSGLGDMSDTINALKEMLRRY